MNIEILQNSYVHLHDLGDAVSYFSVFHHQFLASYLPYICYCLSLHN